MNKMFGAVLGIIIVNSLFMTEFDNLRIRIFFNIFLGNSDLENIISIENMLFTSTSFKFFIGALFGYGIAKVIDESIKIDKIKKINETQEVINYDKTQPLPHTHVRCPDCRDKIRKEKKQHCVDTVDVN